MELEFTKQIITWGISHPDMAILFSDGLILVGFSAYFGGVFNGRRKGVYLRTLWHDLLPVAAVVILSSLLKYAFPAERPFLKLGVESLVSSLDPLASFPSMHVAIATAFAVTLLKHHRPIGLFVTFLVPFIMLGRVLIGAHFPHDVLAGAFIGCTVAFIMVKMKL